MKKCGGYIQRFEGFTAVTDTEGGRRGYDCPEPKGTKIFNHPEVCRNVIKLNQHMAQKSKIIFLFYQKPPRKHENLYLYFSIFYLLHYIQSLLKTEAESAPKILAASSKNFTTVKVQKKKLCQYLFCQKRFKKINVCIIFILNFVNCGVDIYHMTSYVTLVSVNVSNIKLLPHSTKKCDICRNR